MAFGAVHEGGFVGPVGQEAIDRADESTGRVLVVWVCAATVVFGYDAETDESAARGFAAGALALTGAAAEVQVVPVARVIGVFAGIGGKALAADGVGHSTDPGELEGDD